MQRSVTILTDDPTLEIIAEQRLVDEGILAMAAWVKAHRPECISDQGLMSIWGLLPHSRWDVPHAEYDPEQTSIPALSDNEILVEIAGRSCYHSFGDKAGKKTNHEYMGHIVSMDPMHNSILYHAKMTFFFAGVSRKFSHQFIRNYVGSDRDEEGSPSQESTRFTHHYGYYVAPPYIAEHPEELELFRADCQDNYNKYCAFIMRQKDAWGATITTAQKKDIHEAAAGLLNMSAETSFVWTCNPMSIRKFLRERCSEAADAEIDRFASKLARLCFDRWPNLFLGQDLEGVRMRSGFSAHL